jgi:hypothetical protein
MKTFILAILVLVAITPASAQLYQWTDENGVKHWGDAPPPSADDAAELQEDKITAEDLAQDAANRVEAARQDYKRVVDRIDENYQIAKKYEKATVYIVDQGVKYFNRTKYHVEYSWKVELHNITNKDHNVYIKFMLLNANDYVIEWTNENVVVPAWEQNTYSGTGIMKCDIADQVERTRVQINIR